MNWIRPQLLEKGKWKDLKEKLFTRLLFTKNFKEDLFFARRFL